MLDYRRTKIEYISNRILKSMMSKHLCTQIFYNQNFQNVHSQLRITIVGGFRALIKY